MFSFLSADSKFMITLSRFTDLIILNLLFLVTSIPIFTIGAGCAALYTLSFRMLRNREGSIVKDYFRAFGENFAVQCYDNIGKDRIERVGYGDIVLDDRFFIADVLDDKGVGQTAVVRNYGRRKTF